MFLFDSKMESVVGYYRTSSATNVGEDRDSLTRQQAAVRGYAKAHGMEVVAEYYDAAVSGTVPVHERDQFTSMLGYIQENKTNIILVETANRFARDLVVQLTGHDLLKAQGVDLVPVDAPMHFLEDTPTAIMVRNILGAVSEHEKATLVAKLKSGRDRKRQREGKCEGRKSYQELDPMLVHEAHRLHRKSPSTGKRRSLRKISQELHKIGFGTAKGKPFSASQVQRLVARR